MPVRTGELTLAAVVLAAAMAPGQQQAGDAELVVAVAAAPQRAGVPALAWLCERWLPMQSCWPADQDPRAPFQLAWTVGGVRVAATSRALPAGIAAAGSLQIGGGSPVLLHCHGDGIEDWYVPQTFEPPASWRQRLAELGALTTGRPHTLATSVVVGHLAGALAPDDSLAAPVQLGSALCGDVTWLAWPTPDGLRVRGRSDGGLLVPAVLAVLAPHHGAATPSPTLRAFGAADGERAEAARQLGRAPDAERLRTLRALLHADDPTRLAAIDALVRAGATGDLPAIVAAAAAGSPGPTLAAHDALARLWPAADAAVRQRTRAALAGSANAALRAIDVDRLAVAADTAPAGAAPRALRALVWLLAIAIGLLGWWWRERLLVAKHAS